MLFRYRCRQLALGLALIGLPLIAAQEDQRLQIKVQSRLVLVDLIATDNEGNFVSDLRPSEIRISEDGKERDIISLDVKGAALRGDAVAAAPVSSAEPLPADAQASPGTSGGVTLAFLVDLNSIAPSQFIQVKEAIAGFVRSKTSPNDRLILALMNNHKVLRHSPTADRAMFLQDLDNAAARGDSFSRLLRFGDELDILLIQMKSADLDPQMVCRNATSFGRQFIMEEEEQMRSAYAGALDFIREIGSLPGRKNVLFFSGGYRPKIGLVIQDMLLRFFGGVALKAGDNSTVQIKSTLGAMASATLLESYVQKIIEEANRARVALYTVDARALVAREDGRFKRSGPHSEELWREETSQPQNLLRDLAAGTGGRWFLNSNDLGRGIDAVYHDSSHYYELGYVPAGDPAPGKLHRITLAVSRPGIRLNYRQSYMEPVEFDPEQRVLENAFRFPGLFEDFPLEAVITVLGGEQKIEVLVPTRYLVFGSSGGRRRCELSVRMALFDAAGNLYGGKPLFAKTYKLDFSEAEYSKVSGYNNVTSTYRGLVTPGDYRLRVVVRQHPAAKTAALEKRITVEPR